MTLWWRWDVMISSNATRPAKSRPQSSQHSEPLWNDPWPERVALVRETRAPWVTGHIGLQHLFTLSTLFMVIFFSFLAFRQPNIPLTLSFGKDRKLHHRTVTNLLCFDTVNTFSLVVQLFFLLLFFYNRSNNIQVSNVMISWAYRYISYKTYYVQDGSRDNLRMI